MPLRLRTSGSWSRDGDKLKTKPTAAVAAMMCDSGLDNKASFTVQSQVTVPSIITLTKTPNDLTMEEVDVNPMPEFDADGE